MGIAVAREFARYRLLRVPLIGVPRAVVRDLGGKYEEMKNEYVYSAGIHGKK